MIGLANGSGDALDEGRDPFRQVRRESQTRGDGARCAFGEIYQQLRYLRGDRHFVRLHPVVGTAADHVDRFTGARLRLGVRFGDGSLACA